MPVGPITPEEIRETCGVERKREFIIHSSMTRSKVVEKKTWPYKGKMKTYPKIENHAHITSYAALSPSMVTLHHALRSTPLARMAPAGMAFERDDNGVKLVRVSDGMEYHPTREEWYSPKFATLVRARMAENFSRRKAANRDKRNFDRMVKSTRVTLDDSRRAGNCIEGSLAFAERKLRMTREEILSGRWLVSVPAKRLLAVANGDRPRVEAAIRAAYARETMVSI
jgi:hypothetical protein